MNITLLGNCQTKALSWYIEQLDQSVDVRWICIEKFLPDWGWRTQFRGKPINIITDVQEGTKRLQSSDYVIFQHIQPRISDNYNTEQLKKYVAGDRLISISSMFYDPADPEQKYFKGMVTRAEKSEITIPAHKLIEKHGDKITMQDENHPNSFYFLELVRGICGIIGLEYYSDEQYNQYLKDGYPFG